MNPSLLPPLSNGENYRNPLCRKHCCSMSHKLSQFSELYEIVITIDEEAAGEVKQNPPKHYKTSKKLRENLNLVQNIKKFKGLLAFQLIM